MISVIIPSFNQSRYLAQAIQSVLENSVTDVEVVVIDGGSDDSSIQILKTLGSKVRWISERDEGQADALNKGLQMVRGNILGWLNADDMYEPNALKEVEEAFGDSSASWVIGDVANLYEATSERQHIASPTISLPGLCANPDLVRQPGTFFRVELVKRVGGWDRRFHMVLDLDLWFRLAHVAPPHMVHKCWAVFRIHEDQKTSGRNVLRQLREILVVLKREKTAPWVRLQIIQRKLIAYCKYVVKRVLISMRVIDQRYRTVPYSHRKQSLRPTNR